MEAIKKAQELRLQKGTPFFKDPGSFNAKRPRVGKYFWRLYLPGLGLILLFFIWGNYHLPERTPPREIKVASVEVKAPPISPATKKESPEVSKEKTPPPRLEKPQAAAKLLQEEKREQPIAQQQPIQKKMDEEQKVGQAESPESKGAPAIVPPPERAYAAETKETPSATQATSASISSPPAPPPPEAFRKSFAIEKEGEKDQPAQAADVLTHFNQGVYFSRQREMTKALQSYQKVIELDPAQAEAYNNMGILYQDLGDFDRAREVYQKALEINPRYEKAHNNLGTLFYLANRYEESMAAFQKALAINPRNIESYCNLGALYKKIGQGEKAVECYQKALTINPIHRETHYNIGLLYEHAEQVELAIDHYQKFIQLSSRTHPGLVTQVKRNLNYLIRTLKDRKKGPLPINGGPKNRPIQR